MKTCQIRCHPTLNGNRVSGGVTDTSSVEQLR